MLDEVLDVLAHLGEECVCHNRRHMTDVGERFHCVEHGNVIVTKIDVTSMEGGKLSYLVGLQDYA